MKYISVIVGIMACSLFGISALSASSIASVADKKKACLNYENFKKTKQIHYRAMEDQCNVKQAPALKVKPYDSSSYSAANDMCSDCFKGCAGDHCDCGSEC